MLVNALQVLKHALTVTATSHDPVLNQLSALVDREFCAAPGLRLRDRSVDVVVNNFVDHAGRMHDRLQIPVDFKFIASDTARGRTSYHGGRGFVTLSYAKAAAAVVDVGPDKYVPATDVYYILYKSTLVHEIYHVLSTATGITRFIAEIERVRFPGETPEQYRQRYHYSDTEVVSHTAQLLYVVSKRLDAKLARLSVRTDKLKRADAEELEHLLTSPPAKMLQVLVEAKLAPVKMGAWLKNIQLPQAPPIIYANLLRQLARLQSLFRSKYEHARYYGA